MNEAQQNALAAVKRGENIFLTGPGGTGKSYTIGQIVKWARETDVLVAVTAMTGCAALLLSELGLYAKTLHSWAGVGLATESPSQLAAMIEKKSRNRRNIQDTKLLIVDEVSMMTPEFLEKLDLVFQRVRRNQNFFGGMQLVLAGDFCQLPPISQVTTFAFESPLWSNMKICALSEIVRQKDPVFQRILNEARMGTLSLESIATLKTRVGLDWSSLAIKPTLIFSRNKDVDRINQENMLAIEGPSKTFTAQTVYKTVTKLNPELQGLLDRLDKDSTYEPVLELKVGAQVMLITNSLASRTPDLVNGSRGVVTGWTGGGLPLVQFTSGPPIPVDRVTWSLPEGVGRSQIPLKIAYAITVHKSQGVSLDSALIDIGSSVFEYGQAYVALSRVRSLEGLYIHRLQSHAIVCHPKVKAFYTV